MKKTLLLFFTVSLLGLGNITAMKPQKAAVAKMPYRVIQDKTYYPYMNQLKSKTADELKAMLQDLILQDFNTMEDPETVANKITLVMKQLDTTNPNITFTKDDIQLLNKLILFNSLSDLKRKVPELIQWLLNHGMPINTITNDPFLQGKQIVPLILAIEIGDQKIVELLLAHGADQNIPLIIDHPTIASTPRDIAGKPEYYKSLNTLNNYAQKTHPLPVSSTGKGSSPSSNASISGSSAIGKPSIASPSISSSPAQPPVATGTPSMIPPIKSSEPKKPMSTNLQTQLPTMSNQELAQLLEEELTDEKDEYANHLPLIWQEIQKRDPRPPYQITFTNQKMLCYLITEDILDGLTNDFRTELIRGLISRGIPIDAAHCYNATPLTLAIRVGFPEKVELLLNLGARTDALSDTNNDLLPRQELEALKKKTHVDKRVSERIEALLNQYDSNKPTTHPLQWNITRGKIVAALISAGWIAAFYRWWTGNKSAQHKQNVLINKTGSDIFVRGSQVPLAHDAFLSLPESGILWIKLNKDQDDAKDLKIDMADYADDLEDSYLNLTIRKKWFANWFTIPLFTSDNWIDTESD